MATLNLGAIRYNWKGAYNSSTDYVVNDVVSNAGNSYVCIQAHTTAQALGNATAYWNIMSSAGTNGTNGTDVGTVITTQGDILYRDGSGLQRLAKGSAGQALIMNTAANAPEWGAASAGKILKVYNHTVASNISTSSNSYQDTGLTITLTPSSASNDFLIVADLGVTRHASTNASFFAQILRDSTAVVAHGGGYMGYNATSNDRGYYPMFLHHLDIPNSTSSITYKIQYRSEINGQTVHSYGSRRMTIFEIDGGIE